MPACRTWMFLAAFLFALALPGQAAPKAKGPTVAQLQTQLKKAQQERDEFKERLAATATIQEDLAAAQKGRDLAKQEAEDARRELDQMKATLSENRNSGDSIFRDLKKAKADLEASQALVASLRKDLAEARRPVSSTPAGGVLVLAEDITPANPMNLRNITPRTKKADAGVVVVNVLIAENGEVVAARLLQPLPGEGEANRQAEAACVEAAKRIVFDPARGADGRTKVRVWQGVGFWLE